MIILSMLQGLLSFTVFTTGCYSEKSSATPTETSVENSRSGNYIKNPTFKLATNNVSGVVARVGETNITLSDFFDYLTRKSPPQMSKHDATKYRIDVLDEMINFELLALDAEKRGYANSPEAIHEARRMMIQEMIKRLTEEEGIKLAKISDREIEDFYQRGEASFIKPPEVSIAHIILKDRKKAQVLLQKIKSLPDDMKLFRDIARSCVNNLKDECRYEESELFYENENLQKSKSKIPGVVRKASFSMHSIGEIYNKVIISEEGYHLIKITGKLPKTSLEEVRRQIRVHLLRKKRDTFVEAFVLGLRKKYDVIENKGVLDLVRVGPVVAKLKDTKPRLSLAKTE